MLLRPVKKCRSITISWQQWRFSGFGQQLFILTMKNINYATWHLYIAPGYQSSHARSLFFPCDYVYKTLVYQLYDYSTPFISLYSTQWRPYRNVPHKLFCLLSFGAYIIDKHEGRCFVNIILFPEGRFALEIMNNNIKWQMLQIDFIQHVYLKKWSESTNSQTYH